MNKKIKRIYLIIIFLIVFFCFPHGVFASNCGPNNLGFCGGWFNSYGGYNDIHDPQGQCGLLGTCYYPSQTGCNTSSSACVDLSLDSCPGGWVTDSHNAACIAFHDVNPNLACCSAPGTTGSKPPPYNPGVTACSQNGGTCTTGCGGNTVPVSTDPNVGLNKSCPQYQYDWGQFQATYCCITNYCESVHNNICGNCTALQTTPSNDPNDQKSCSLLTGNQCCVANSSSTGNGKIITGCSSPNQCVYDPGGGVAPSCSSAGLVSTGKTCDVTSLGFHTVGNCCQSGVNPGPGPGTGPFCPNLAGQRAACLYTSPTCPSGFTEQSAGNQSCLNLRISLGKGSGSAVCCAPSTGNQCGNCPPVGSTCSGSPAYCEANNRCVNGKQMEDVFKCDPVKHVWLASYQQPGSGCFLNPCSTGLGSGGGGTPTSGPPPNGNQCGGCAGVCSNSGQYCLENVPCDGKGTSPYSKVYACLSGVWKFLYNQQYKSPYNACASTCNAPSPKQPSFTPPPSNGNGNKCGACSGSCSNPGQYCIEPGCQGADKVYACLSGNWKFLYPQTSNAQSACKASGCSGGSGGVKYFGMCAALNSATGICTNDSTCGSQGHSQYFNEVYTDQAGTNAKTACGTQAIQNGLPSGTTVRCCSTSSACMQPPLNGTCRPKNSACSSFGQQDAPSGGGGCDATLYHCCVPASGQGNGGGGPTSGPKGNAAHCGAFGNGSCIGLNQSCSSLGANYTSLYTSGNACSGTSNGGVSTPQCCYPNVGHVCQSQGGTCQSSCSGTNLGLSDCNPATSQKICCKSGSSGNFPNPPSGSVACGGSPAGSTSGNVCYPSQSSCPSGYQPSSLGGGVCAQQYANGWCCLKQSSSGGNPIPNGTYGTCGSVGQYTCTTQCASPKISYTSKVGDPGNQCGRNTTKYSSGTIYCCMP